MKIVRNLALPVLAFFVMGLASCSSDEDVVKYSTNALKNTELMNILKQKGYQFDKDGKLELNDLANNTTSLDLSGTKLKDLSGLDILPNLKDVKLSNNEYGPTFDFAKLPAQVTGVDLTGNGIYEFKGLTNTDNVEATGYEATDIKRHFEKLYLPEGAKYDQDQIVAFYKKSEMDKKAVDMKMADANGKLNTYNTLRNVPDAIVRKQLYESFSQLFVITENKDTLIDVSRRMTSPEQSNNPIVIFEGKNADGFQYVLHNKSFKGTTLGVTSEEYTKVPYLKMPKQISFFQLEHLDLLNGIDMSANTDLFHGHMYTCRSIKKMDMSHSTKLGQRSIPLEMTDVDVSWVEIKDCPDLEEIIFPKKAYIMNNMTFCYLPKLKKLDLSQFESFWRCDLYELKNAQIIYPTMKYSVYMGKKTQERHSGLGIDQDIFNRQETKDFIKNNIKYIDNNSFEVEGQYMPHPWGRHEDVRWMDIWKKKPW